mmetsp:Transcript_2066/g.2812  ORF Transcript_2066/g.2812 Transcript_2066/m.2812 type:complete len:404 (+) Transcript_2066:373-1584(+)
MKFLNAYIALSVLLEHTQAATNLRSSSDPAVRRLVDNDDIQFIEFEATNGVCNYDMLVQALAEVCPDCDLVELLGKNKESSARNKVDRLCKDAIADNSNTRRGGAYDFKDITGEGYQFDNEFYDGGTPLNAEYDPVDIANSQGGADIERVYNDVSKNQLITFPSEYLKDNFLENCEAQAVMCCWVQDRQAGDNNGNCNSNDCYDEDPADNTDICWVDLHAAAKSNHVEGGFAIFPGNTATTGEGDAHCHGFAWSNDPNSPDYRYRGNVLFYVSMYDHLEQRGYVRNVPGATMCSCIDKSPTASRADCTNVEVTETFKFERVQNGNSANNNIDAASIVDIDVVFNNCPTSNTQNNDLRRWYDKLEGGGVTTEASDNVFNKHIIGDCDNGDYYEEFLASKGFALK